MTTSLGSGDLEFAPPHLRQGRSTAETINLGAGVGSSAASNGRKPADQTTSTDPRQLPTVEQLETALKNAADRQKAEFQIDILANPEDLLTPLGKLNAALAKAYNGLVDPALEFAAEIKADLQGVITNFSTDGFNQKVEDEIKTLQKETAQDITAALEAHSRDLKEHSAKKALLRREAEQKTRERKIHVVRMSGNPDTQITTFSELIANKPWLGLALAVVLLGMAPLEYYINLAQGEAQFGATGGLSFALAMTFMMIVIPPAKAWYDKVYGTYVEAEQGCREYNIDGAPVRPFPLDNLMAVKRNKAICTMLFWMLLAGMFAYRVWHSYQQHDLKTGVLNVVQAMLMLMAYALEMEIFNVHSKKRVDELRALERDESRKIRELDSLNAPSLDERRASLEGEYQLKLNDTLAEAQADLDDMIKNRDGYKKRLEFFPSMRSRAITNASWVFKSFIEMHRVQTGIEDAITPEQGQNQLQEFANSLHTIETDEFKAALEGFTAIDSHTLPEPSNSWFEKQWNDQVAHADALAKKQTPSQPQVIFDPSKIV